ncbi:MAG: hypothetical protein P4M00_14650 [Azospirillaceae bacterium]|nr:hypothetical protein [Azospirillaceae bacterium]
MADATAPGIGDIDPQIIAGIPDGELADYLVWRERVHNTNISEKTLLATDFLNHFNEIVMLVEMVPDMPEMIEDCRMWEPKGYQDHFRQSGFSDKELAIAAYEHVPSKFKVPFEDTIVQMNTVVLATLAKLASLIEEHDPDRLRLECQLSVELMNRVAQVANGIIHGTTHVMEQSEIDAFIGT